MRKKWLLLPTLFLLASCSNVAERSFVRPYLLADQTIDNVKIGDKYQVEEKTLTYLGESKVVKGQIILPDGTSKSGDSFIIEMPGIYTVKYRAFFGTHEESYCIYYHCHKTSGDFFVSSNKDNPATNGEYSHPRDAGPITGAKLSLDMKTVFTYDKVIDFSSYNSNESFIDFVVDTSDMTHENRLDSGDIETFTVRLTDVEDNNNFVDISVTDSGPTDDEGYGCYLLAGSNSQFKTGYEGGRNGLLHISKYGTNVGMSFRDLPERSEQIARLYFNYSNKELYVSPLINSGVKDIITDLDDKDIYGSSIWEGFKSGKATLSIFANSLRANTGTVIVTKIATQDLSSLDFVDEAAPTIKVDYKGQSSISVPKASVGKPYQIFEAEISDNFDNNLSYDNYVTFDDTGAGKTRDISITNGKFTPDKAGVYTITYTARDHSNNVATKTVDVTAINDAQTITITLDENTITQDIFSKVTLPSTEAVKTKVSGGSGKSTIVRTVYDTNNKPMEIKGDSFVPDTVGAYKVYYQATDYIGNIATALLTVDSIDPGHPVFIEDFALPRVAIKGHKYRLPAYQGAEVINGKTTYLESKVFVNEAELTGDNEFTAGESCNVKYILNGTTGNQQYAKSIDVINVGKPLDLSKYFVGNFDKFVDIDNVTLASSLNNPKAFFASVLPYDNPYVKFAIDRSNIHFQELVIKFSDSTQLNNSLTFHVKFRMDQTYISLGDSAEEIEFPHSEEAGGEAYAIDILNSTRVLKDALHKELLTVKTNDQGEPFTGFTGGIYLDVEMVNNTGTSSLKMLNVSNQPLGKFDLGDDYFDFTTPVIIFNNEFAYEQSYGNNAYIPTVQVFDVLSNVQVTVSARAPDDTFKFTNKDATKSHTFLLDQFGEYLITYKATDAEGNYVSYPRKISVYDYTTPELTITGKLKSSYSLNAPIKIPAYKVSDNLNDYTLDIFVIMPDNQQRLLLIDHNGEVTSYLEKNNMLYNASFKVNSTTFRAEQRGNYTLRYVAYDSDFNRVIKELYFTVK